MSPITLPARASEPVPNPEFVYLLEAALHVLWDGNGKRDILGPTPEMFICLAIDEAAPEDIPRYVKHELHSLIEERLNDGTFCVWAHEQGVFDMPSIQAGRKAWVLDLITEFGG